MNPLRLAVVIVSTRPIRVGLPVGNWFFEAAKAHGQFDAELVDLKQVNLPLFDEPKHPRLGEYEHAHTKAWSATVSAADAFVFVTPEYNYFTPPSLVNAIDYLHREWFYKPAGIVSYGGIAGGTRSAQMTKLLLTGVKVMPMSEGVPIPFVNSHVEDGVFKPTEAMLHATKVMLDELHRWAVALRPLRG